jgi:hypothetical protein
MNGERCPPTQSSPSAARPITQLVLLHGLAVSRRYLMPLAARFADHHPVHVIDLPGCGLSGEPGRVLDVAEHADHVAAWLERSGLAPVVSSGTPSAARSRSTWLSAIPTWPAVAGLPAPHERPCVAEALDGQSFEGRPRPVLAAQFGVDVEQDVAPDGVGRVPSTNRL